MAPGQNASAKALLHCCYVQPQGQTLRKVANQRIKLWPLFCRKYAGTAMRQLQRAQPINSLRRKGQVLQPQTMSSLFLDFLVNSMYKHLTNDLTVCNQNSACYDKKSLLRQLYSVLRA